MPQSLCILHGKFAVVLPALRTLADALVSKTAAGAPCTQRPGTNAKHRGEFPGLKPSLSPTGRQCDQLAYISGKLLNFSD